MKEKTKTKPNVVHAHIIADAANASLVISPQVMVFLVIFSQGHGIVVILSQVMVFLVIFSRLWDSWLFFPRTWYYGYFVRSV